MNDFLELTQGLIESNNFEEEEFVPVPNGTYRVSVANVEKRTSQSGNDYVSFSLEIIDGEFAERKIFDNFHLTAKTAEGNIKRIYKLAEMCDIKPVAFSDVDAIVDFCKDFIGKPFDIDYADEAFHKVKYISAL